MRKPPSGNWNVDSCKIQAATHISKTTTECLQTLRFYHFAVNLTTPLCYDSLLK